MPQAPGNVKSWCGMNDQELWDKVVALDIKFASDTPIAKKLLLCDWRIAGELMGACNKAWIKIGYDYISEDWQVRYNNYIVDNECLPRAIIEACAEALTKKSA